MKGLVKSDSRALEFASEALVEDANFVVSCLDSIRPHGNGVFKSLQNRHSNLLDNNEFFLSALAVYPMGYGYFTRDLRENYALSYSVLHKNIHLFHHLDASITEHLQISLYAVNNLCARFIPFRSIPLGSPPSFLLYLFSLDTAVYGLSTWNRLNCVMPSRNEEGCLIDSTSISFPSLKAIAMRKIFWAILSKTESAGHALIKLECESIKDQSLDGLIQRPSELISVPQRLIDAFLALDLPENLTLSFKSYASAMLLHLFVLANKPLLPKFPESKILKLQSLALGLLFNDETAVCDVFYDDPVLLDVHHEDLYDAEPYARLQAPILTVPDAWQNRLSLFCRYHSLENNEQAEASLHSHELSQFN